MNLVDISRVDSFAFICFLLASLVIYYSFGQSKIILLVSGILFYASFSIKLTLLVLIASCINFAFGILLSKKKFKKLLPFTILLNLFFLGYFKYLNFLLDILSVDNPLANNFTQNIIIPIGISFLTFEFIHYIVDVWKGKKPLKNPLDFLIFIFFFPSLIAGPIKRFEQFVPQLIKSGRKRTNLRDGIILIIEGFFKKIVLAASFSEYVFKFNSLISYPIQTIIGFYFFSLYIYFDFSGYIDIARGSAKLYGINLPINFNRPYFATSIQDFWTKWNISLMLWIRDYIYIPLGGSKKSTLRTQMNIIIVFLISGLWHGAGKNFIVWGLYNAVLIIIQKGIRPLRFINFLPLRTKKLFATFMTFNLITIGWILFNNNLNLISDAFSANHSSYKPHLFIDDKLILVIFISVVYLAFKKFFFKKRKFIGFLGYGLLILITVLYSNNIIRPFIYFSF